MLQRCHYGHVLFALFALISLVFCPGSVLSKQNHVLNSETIDAFVSSEMESGNIPGLSLAIVKGERVLHLRGYGKAGPGKGEVTPQTPFILGSVSKSFTGLAIMQLVENQLLSLDDQVIKILPWFRMGSQDEGDAMTIAHLLNHTSGIPAYDSNDSGMESGRSIEERIRIMNNSELKSPPGEKYEYANLNYDILGLIIQEISGLSYQNYITQNIFQPLEMTRSFISLDEAEKEGLATGYRPWFGILQPIDINYGMSALPSGYIISSAEDMTHYLMLFLNGGKYKDITLLSEKGVLETQNAIGDTNYGAGWFSGSYYKWHTGEIANYNAYICTIPSEQLGIVMLSNTNDIGIKFLNRGSSSLRRIPDGIRMMLMGGDLPDRPLFNINSMYLLVDIAAILVFAVLAAVLTVSVKADWKGDMGYLSWLIKILVLMIVPIIVLLSVPHIIQGSWHALLISVPDLTLAVLIYVLMLLAAGLSGIISMMYSLFKRKGIQKNEEGLK